MPEKSGLQVLRELKRDTPNLRVIMLSMHAGSNYVIGSLKHGAAGYLSKESAPEELINAIQTVMSGKRYLSHTLGEFADSL